MDLYVCLKVAFKSTSECFYITKAAKDQPAQEYAALAMLEC